jgi:hypothetical protein
MKNSKNTFNPSGTFTSKDSARKQIINFLNQDRKDGVKKAWYYWHYQMEQPTALDTPQQLEGVINLYKSQGIELYKTTPITNELCEVFGIKGGNHLKFRALDETKNLSGNFDPFSFAFDWMIGTAEFSIFELELGSKIKSTNDSVKPFMFGKTEIKVITPNGLKSFKYGDKEVFAINKKNADRKAKILGYVNEITYC